MINAIIVDDEKRAVSNLKGLLAKHCADVNVCGEANSIQEAEPLIRTKVPDVIFLDIEMPGGNGFDLLDNISDLNIHVVFVTAFDAYAIDAFKANAINYILKPIDSELLISVVEHLKKIIGSASSNIKEIMNSMEAVKKVERIKVPTVNGFEFIPSAEILYLQSNGSYSQLILKGGKKILLSKNLGKIEKDLDANYFFRTHREYIVNIKEIHKYIKGAGGLVVLRNGQAIPVAVRRKQALLDLMSAG